MKKQSCPPPIDYFVAAETGRLTEITPWLTEASLQARPVSHHCASLQPEPQDSWLHVAIKCGHTDQVPAALLTPEVIKLRGSDNSTVLHCACGSPGALNYLKTFLDEDTCKMEDKLKRTPLHLAAMWRENLIAVPKKLLTLENMLKLDLEGYSPLLNACCGPNVDLLPAQVLTPEALVMGRASDLTPINQIVKLHQQHHLPNDTRKALNLDQPHDLVQAAEEGWLFFIPELLTQESLETNPLSSWMHSAAVYGHINQVPKHLLTRENLLRLDGVHNTVLHCCCIGRACLHQVPKEVLTPEALEMKGASRETLLQYASKRVKALKAIPRELLTQERMNKRDPGQDSAFCLAVINGGLNLLPKELVTVENFRQPCKCGRSIAFAAVKHGYAEQVPSEILNQIADSFSSMKESV